MTFDDVLEQALEMLRRRGRGSYRALKVQFQLDDDLLALLRAEIVEVHQLARDQEGTMLVWTGDPAPVAPPLSPPPAQAPAPLTYTPPHLAEKILTSRSVLEGERKQVPDVSTLFRAKNLVGLLDLCIRQRGQGPMRCMTPLAVGEDCDVGKDSRLGLCSRVTVLQRGSCGLEGMQEALRDGVGPTVAGPGQGWRKHGVTRW